MNAINFLKERPEIYVSLPANIFQQKMDEYFKAPPHCKGIIVEMLISLALRRIFNEKVKLPVDIYYFADLIVEKHYIDIKTTTKRVYQKPTPDRALSNIKDTDYDFSFVLVSPEEWDSEKNTIKLRIHEIQTYDSSGNLESFKPAGSYKEFQQ